MDMKKMGSLFILGTGAIILAVLLVRTATLENKLKKQQAYIISLEKNFADTLSESHSRAKFIERVHKLIGKRNPRMRTVQRKQIAEKVYYFCREYNVNKDLVIRMIAVESDFYTNAKSNYGAIGFMQVVPYTFHYLCTKYKLGKRDIFDVSDNIEVGIIYLAHLRDLYGNMNTVLGRYNAGKHWEKYYEKYIRKLDGIDF